MVIIMGKSGAGKTTVLDELVKLGFKRAVTYTTRPIRPNEKAGVDYEFVSTEEFERMEKAGMFAETAHTGMYEYGSLKVSYMDEMTVIILTPVGAENVMRRLGKENLLVVYLDADHRLLIKRLRERGDDPKEIIRRLSEDESRFGRAYEICDFRIQQDEKTDAAQTALLISWLAPKKGGCRDEAC